MARDLAGVRARIKKEMFDDLDQEDKDYYEFMSKEELKTAIAQWEEDRKSNAPSTSPEARQRYISIYLFIYCSYVLILFGVQMY